MTLTPDLQAIVQIIECAGKDILIPRFQQQQGTQIKDDGSIVTQADLSCQSFLQEKLQALAPSIGFLGEEMRQCEQITCLQSSERFWCVDPLDGTSNFATPMPLFAISVALIEAGQPIMACIHDPIRQETFTAIRGQGLRLNGKKSAILSEKSLKECVGFLDFKRLPLPLASHFATQSIYRSQRNLGTCALEWAWFAVGRAQFIVHGKEKLWDYAAGSLLAEEAGYIIHDFMGNHPFQKAQLNSSIIASHANIHTQLLNILTSSTP